VSRPTLGEAGLPDGWTVRRPTVADVDEILAMVHACDVAAVGEPDFTPHEVVEILTGPHHEPERDSWLVHDQTGRLAGWAYLDNKTAGVRDLSDVYTHPGFGQPALAPLVALLLARSAERARAFGHAELTVRAGAIANETAYVAALRGAGFRFIKRYARMRVELAGRPATEPWPPGVHVRPLDRTDDELHTFHRILEDAFSELPDYLPCDYPTYRQRLAALPSISWDEWYVAECDGALAGILASADQAAEDDEGWVKNLAVAKQYRGRGIGAALLQTAFDRYAANGRVRAGLGVDMTNPTGAYRLYRRVGMSAVYEADVYETTVRSA
jgi:mycothiol synthase